MRAICTWIMRIVSLLMVIPSSRIWCTNSPTRSLARVFCSGSRASFPLSMIWSSSEALPSAAAAPAAAAAASGVSSAIGSSLERSLDLLLALGVRGDLLQQGHEVVVAVEFGDEVVQALARFEELAQRLDLLHERLRPEVADVRELQLDHQLAVVVLQPVRNGEGQTRPDRLHHVVEVVAVDLHELARLDRRRRVLGLARQVGQDADDERELLLLDRAAGLDVVRDLHAGRPDAA